MSIIVNPHVLWYPELCYNVVRDNILFIVSLLNCQYLDIKLQKGFHNHEEIFKNQLFLLKKVCFLVRLWPIVTFSFYNEVILLSFFFASQGISDDEPLLPVPQIPYKQYFCSAISVLFYVVWTHPIFTSRCKWIYPSM